MNQFPFSFDPSSFGDDFSFDPKKAGEIFTQLGNMISGLGGALQNPSAHDPLASSTELAWKTCKDELPDEKPITPSETKAVKDAITLADVWLDSATILPASPLEPQAWTCIDWAEKTLPQWVRLCEPLATKTCTIWSDSLPEEHQQFSAMLNDLTRRISTFSLGNQLGSILTTIAQDSLTSTDSGFVLDSQNVPALLPRKIDQLAESLSVSADELRLYLAARESAHHRLHRYAPWLNPLVFTLVEQYAQAISIDYDSMKYVLEGLDFEKISDENALNDILSEHLGKATITEEQQKLKDRIHSILALIEGWIEVVVRDAVSDRLPAYNAMEEILRRRRATGTGADQALANLIGMELRPNKIRESAQLFTKVGNDLGIEQRDKIWAHPDIIPQNHEIDNITSFLDRLLDSQTHDSIDTALQELLNSENPPQE